MHWPPRRPPLFPYTTLFRSGANQWTMRLTNPDRSGGAEISLPLPDFLEDRVVKGTDVVVVRRMVPVDGLWPAGRQVPVGVFLTLHRAHDLQGRLTMITSCSKSDVVFYTDGHDRSDDRR